MFYNKVSTHVGQRKWSKITGETKYKAHCVSRPLTSASIKLRPTVSLTLSPFSLILGNKISGYLVDLFHILHTNE